MVKTNCHSAPKRLKREKVIHQNGSRYHDLLSVVEDDLGSPIEQQFTEVCHKIWGNSKNNNKLKAEFKSILVPKNCIFMKAPYLNPEIYSRISDPAVNKDKAAERKQRETVKANIPLMKVIVSLKEIETEIRKNVSPNTFEKLKSISPQLHQSFRVLNASFTDIQRKRKGNVWSSLGRHFKQFSQSDSSKQYLFNEPAMKHIREEMKNSDNNKQRPQFSSYPSKKWSSSQKSQRGPHYKGNNNYNKQQHKTYQP